MDVNNLISIESGLSVGSYDIETIEGPVTFTKRMLPQGYEGIGKSFLDMENMLVLKDEKGLFGSSFSDSLRTMATKNTKHVLAVIYYFGNEIDLESLLEDAKQAFVKYGNACNVEMSVI